jgi:apolipoprotein N-acyltransferase
VTDSRIASPKLGLHIQLGAALAIGIALRFVVGLHPIWWLAWLAPAPLLAVAYRSSKRDAWWCVALAAIIGVSANFPYYDTVMPLPVAFGVTAAQAVLWIGAVMAARRIVLRYRAWWTFLAYPIVWTALDTLMAALLPDGNVTSLAYTQAAFLPIAQLASLFGVPGLVFLITAIPSALALVLAFGGGMRKLGFAIGAGALLLAGALGYGTLRLQQTNPGHVTHFGLVAIDDAIGRQASAAYVARIWDQYDRHIAALAAQGARIIVLPEKIAVLTPSQQLQWQQHLRTLAATRRVWIEAGVGLDEAGRRTNLAWLFAPDGTLSADYQKHHVAPPEREFIAGERYEVRAIDGLDAGLAICKDMHFAAMGRAYAARRVAVMLVPAWDFHTDAWITSRITAMRGIEGGYTVVRSSRDGLLSVSDAYGRFVAQADSSAMPGTALLATVAVADHVPTLYTQIGDLVGWLCVAAAAVLLAVGRRAPLDGRA